MLLPLLLAATVVDGEAALGHAARLAALGPHPWGSPRAKVAAEYVAAEFRRVGLQEVRLQEFEAAGIPGFNVLGVLRAPGREFVVVGAHHDTAPEAHGAYDDGGGVGVLIEVARVLAREHGRRRTLVFASWDGEEAWFTGQTTTAGSRAYVRSLGAEQRNLVGALVIEMCGWKGGAPVLHPIAYSDPLRPGRTVVAPGWLLRTALEGSRRAGAPLGVGDPRLSWLYQPTVRTFRVGLYGDDLSFLQAGLPAVFVSDSSFSAYYPWYHQESDTADKLDAAALARMGRAVHGAVQSLQGVTPGPARDPDWYAAFGYVAGRPALLALGAASVVPVLLRGLAGGGVLLATKLGYAALFGLLLWRHPVVALWAFLFPNLLVPSGRRWLKAAGLLPLVAVAVLGAAAAARGFASGAWLPAWELAVAGFALALLYAGGRPRGAARKRRGARGR